MTQMGGDKAQEGGNIYIHIHSYVFIYIHMYIAMIDSSCCLAETNNML